MKERIGKMAPNFFKILLISLSIMSCEKEDHYEWFDSSINLRPEIPLDANGYYHMEIDRDSTFTRGVFLGKVINSPGIKGDKVIISTRKNENPADGITNTSSDIKSSRNFFVFVRVTNEMIGDTLEIESSVFVGYDANGDRRDAINITNIILD